MKKLLNNTDIYSRKSYISTSMDKDQSKYYIDKKCCLMKIIIPTGNRVLPLFEKSTHTNENEILLDRDGILLVTNVTTEKIRKYQFSPPKDIYVVTCLYSNGIVINDEHDISTIVSVLK